MKLSVNLPNSGRGVVVEIPGIGLVKNGQTYELTDEQQLSFRTVYGHLDDETGQFILGPTVKQAKFPEGVEIEADEPKSTTKKKEE